MATLNVSLSFDKLPIIAYTQADINNTKRQHSRNSWISLEVGTAFHIASHGVLSPGQMPVQFCVYIVFAERVCFVLCPHTILKYIGYSAIMSCRSVCMHINDVDA